MTTSVESVNGHTEHSVPELIKFGERVAKWCPWRGPAHKACPHVLLHFPALKWDLSMLVAIIFLGGVRKLGEGYDPGGGNGGEGRRRARLCFFFLFLRSCLLSRPCM